MAVVERGPHRVPAEDDRSRIARTAVAGLPVGTGRRVPAGIQAQRADAVGRRPVDHQRGPERKLRSQAADVAIGVHGADAVVVGTLLKVKYPLAELFVCS